MAGDASAAGGFDLGVLAPRHWPAPAWHAARVAEEMVCPASEEPMLRVLARMGAQAVPALGTIDWEAELAAFGALGLPSYHRQPFHSIAAAGFAAVEPRDVAPPLWTRLARRELR